MYMVTFRQYEETGGEKLKLESALNCTLLFYTVMCPSFIPDPVPLILKGLKYAKVLKQL